METMNKTLTIELWFTDYVKDAYTDQTGRGHFGNVVYDQVIAHEVGRYDFTDPYTGRILKDSGIIIEDANCRQWKGNPPMDYVGGRWWRGEKPEGIKGTWQSAPHSVKGYCYPDGSTPVKHLIPRPA